MAPSAIPTATAPCDSTTTSGNLPKMGSGANEAPKGNSKKFSSGTSTSVNATWWLPVPLRPNVCQVSRISQCSAGMRKVRVIGPGPSEASMGEPSCIITQVPPINSAFWHQLANGHVPVTRHPPGTRSAVPAG